MMIRNIVLISIFMHVILNANESEAKFLVVDNKTYEQISNLNILNGGIEKKNIISSIRLNKEELLHYYPEYFLYKGQKCNIVNKIYTRNKKISNSMLKLVKKEDILREVRKIKLLQLLSDNNDNDNINVNLKLSKNIIKSIAVICKNSLLIRGIYYKSGDEINKIKIDSIDSKNSILYIKEN